MFQFLIILVMILLTNNDIDLLKKQEPKQIKQLLAYIINEIVVDEKKYLKHIEFKIKGQKFYLDTKEEMEDVRQAR